MAGYGPAAPTIISDLYPIQRRGTVLAWFYMAIPVGSALGFAIGEMYVADRFPAAAKQAATLMVARIRAAMRQDLQTLAWMTPATTAGFGGAEESADALVEFGGDDVLEFASLGVGFGIVDGESVFEEALGEAMTADYVARAVAAGRREVNVAVVELDEAEIGHAGEDAGGGLLRD